MGLSRFWRKAHIQQWLTLKNFYESQTVDSNLDGCNRASSYGEGRVWTPRANITFRKFCHHSPIRIPMQDARTIRPQKEMFLETKNYWLRILLTDLARRYSKKKQTGSGGQPCNMHIFGSLVVLRSDAPMQDSKAEMVSMKMLLEVEICWLCHQLM